MVEQRRWREIPESVGLKLMQKTWMLTSVTPQHFELSRAAGSSRPLIWDIEIACSTEINQTKTNQNENPKSENLIV